MKCGNCGFVNDDDAAFCEDCGSAITTSSGTDSSKRQGSGASRGQPLISSNGLCPTCGSKLDPAGAFCDECGTPVAVPDSVAQVHQKEEHMIPGRDGRYKDREVITTRTAPGASRDTRGKSGKAWDGSRWYLWPIAIIVVASIVVAIALLLPNLLSRSEDEVELPDYSSLTEAEAVEKAEKAGLELEIMMVGVVSEEHGGRVVDQLPLPGSEVTPGSSVTIMIGEYSEKKEATVGEFVTCPECQGNGKVQRDDTRELQVTCPTCGGSGVSPDGGACPTCHGTGLTIQVEHFVKWILCPVCGGNGVVWQEKQ